MVMQRARDITIRAGSSVVAVGDTFSVSAVWAKGRVTGMASPHGVIHGLRLCRRCRCRCCFPVSAKFMKNRAMPSCFSRTADGPKGYAGECLTVGFKTCTKLRSGLHEKSAFLPFLLFNISRRHDSKAFKWRC